MIGIIGRKIGMTQIFNEQGQQIPCTVVEATPNAVTKVIDKAAAGFAAVELGYGAQRTARENAKGERTPRGRRANLAELGHARKAGLDYAPKVLRSPHVDKKSREQFELKTHKRLIDILDSRAQTVDALTKLDLPAGVDVEIKVE